MATQTSGEAVERMAAVMYSALRIQGVRLTHWSPPWEEVGTRQMMRFEALARDLADIAERGQVTKG